MPGVWFLLSKIVPLSLLPTLVLCYGYSVYSMPGSSSEGIVRYAVIDFIVFLGDNELRIFLCCYSEPSPYNFIFAMCSGALIIGEVSDHSDPTLSPTGTIPLPVHQAKQDQVMIYCQPKLKAAES